MKLPFVAVGSLAFDFSRANVLIVSFMPHGTNMPRQRLIWRQQGLDRYAGQGDLTCACHS